MSFNGNKIITTSSGGALISYSKVLKEKAIFYATQSKDGEVHYEHSEIGYNYRMSNICAGVGLGQMKNLNENVIKRRENHSFYKEIFKSIEGVELFEVLNEDYISSYWLNTILINHDNQNKNSENLRLALEEKTLKAERFGSLCIYCPFLKSTLIMEKNS